MCLLLCGNIDTVTRVCYDRFMIFETIILILWLIAAGIPPELHQDFINVATCESHLDHTAIGDNGSAVGIMQIHWYLWYDWAVEQDKSLADLQWDNPVDNFRLAYFIQENYDLPRHRDRWSQWSVKPWYDC